jgi:hypothetical protein
VNLNIVGCTVFQTAPYLSSWVNFNAGDWLCFGRWNNLQQIIHSTLGVCQLSNSLALTEWSTEGGRQKTQWNCRQRIRSWFYVFTLCDPRIVSNSTKSKSVQSSHAYQRDHRRDGRTVSISLVEITRYQGFEMDFHMMPVLPGDVIFSEEFSELTDLFNIYSKIMDSEDSTYPYFNTLINLGPIQWLSRDGKIQQDCYSVRGAQ